MPLPTRCAVGRARSRGAIISRYAATDGGSPTSRCREVSDRQVSYCRPCAAAEIVQGPLDELAAVGDPVNRVLEVDLDGDDVTFALYDLP